MAKPWWKEGVRFECQGSGRCCLSRGTHGYVYLTLKDRQRLARELKLSTREFTRTLCRKEDGWHYLKPLSEDTRPDREHACRFLENNRCTVYEARPAQCRTWPFWPENMGAKAWQKEVVSFCPGVEAGKRGQGKLYTAGEIAALLNEDPLKEADRS